MVNLHTVSLTGLLLVGTAPAFAESPAYGPELQGFQYPHPLQHFAFQSQGKSLQMGYMDVPATGTPN
ncbi:MAG: alpha/beta hydrolase, partial [Pseudomonadota bacterium]